MTEQEEATAPPEKKEPLIEVEFQKLIEIAEFSNAVELINKTISEYHERITTLKSGLNQLLEALPILMQELDTLDDLERRLLKLVIKKLEKSSE